MIDRAMRSWYKHYCCMSSAKNDLHLHNSARWRERIHSVVLRNSTATTYLTSFTSEVSSNVGIGVSCSNCQENTADISDKFGAESSGNIPTLNDSYDLATANGSHQRRFPWNSLWRPPKVEQSSSSTCDCIEKDDKALISREVIKLSLVANIGSAFIQRDISFVAGG